MMNIIYPHPLFKGQGMFGPGKVFTVSGSEVHHNVTDLRGYLIVAFSMAALVFDFMSSQNLITKTY